MPSEPQTILQKRAYYKAYEYLISASVNDTAAYREFIDGIKSYPKEDRSWKLSARTVDAEPSAIECTLGSSIEDLDFFKSHCIQTPTKLACLNLPYEPGLLCLSAKIGQNITDNNQKKELLYLIKEEDYINSDNVQIDTKQFLRIGKEIFPNLKSTEYEKDHIFEIRRQFCYKNEPHLSALKGLRSDVVKKFIPTRSYRRVSSTTTKQKTPEEELIEYWNNGRLQKARSRYNIESKLRIINTKIDEFIKPENVFKEPKGRLTKEEEETLIQIKNELLAKAVQDTYNRMYVNISPAKTKIQLIPQDTCSNFNLYDFAKIAPEYTNISRLFLGIRHKHATLSGTKDREDAELPKYLQTRSDKPFITCNGAVL